MSVTISSEVVATFAVVWQPVCFSNGLTQLTFGSVEPSSQYPAQQITESFPSPGPTDDFTGRLGTLKATAPPELAEPEDDLLLLELPQPAATTATTVTSTSAVLDLIRVPPLGQSERMLRAPTYLDPVTPLFKRVLRRSL